MSGFKKRKFGRYKVSSKEKRTDEGIVFHSELECNCYRYLKTVIPEGKLHLQPWFVVFDGYVDSYGVKMAKMKYIGDFLIGDPRSREDAKLPMTDNQFLIDSKGAITAEFKKKKKMFDQRYKKTLHMPKNLEELKHIVEDIILPQLK
jgi:hypothetical protein